MPESRKGIILPSDGSVDQNWILVIIHVIILAFLPKVYSIINSPLHFHLKQGLHKSL